MKIEMKGGRGCKEGEKEDGKEKGKEFVKRERKDEK